MSWIRSDAKEDRKGSRNVSALRCNSDTVQWDLFPGKAEYRAVAQFPSCRCLPAGNNLNYLKVHLKSPTRFVLPAGVPYLSHSPLPSPPNFQPNLKSFVFGTSPRPASRPVRSLGPDPPGLKGQLGRGSGSPRSGSAS